MEMIIFEWPNWIISLSFMAAVVIDILTHQGLESALRAHHVPMPKLAMIFGIFVKFFSALGLLFYPTVKIAAIALMLFVGVATLIFKSFWTRPKGERAICLAEFLGMTALIGGICALI